MFRNSGYFKFGIVVTLSLLASTHDGQVFSITVANPAHFNDSILRGSAWDSHHGSRVSRCLIITGAANG